MSRAGASLSRRFGFVLVGTAAVAALAAPALAPRSMDDRLDGLLNAPPTRVHLRDERGAWRAPFIYPWRRVSQLEQRYEEDRATPVPLAWFSQGRLVRSSNETLAPLLLLGADSFGRDVFSRLLFGGRLSLSLAFAAALGALIIGAAVGGIAGYVGGLVDDALMRGSDVVLVLPAMYIALALRSVMPLVLEPSTIFLSLSIIFGTVGAPFIARGVRAIVRTERTLDYSVAAVSLGAGHARLLTHHLLPAARGFIAVQLTMLVPGFIVAEATISYVGLGFPDQVASWGTMLQEATTIRAFHDFPWLLTPAAAMFVVVLGLNLMLQGGREMDHTRVL